MDKGSVKALPLRLDLVAVSSRSVKALPLHLDLAAVSSSGHGGEYHLGHRWIYAGR